MGVNTNTRLLFSMFFDKNKFTPIDDLMRGNTSQTPGNGKNADKMYQEFFTQKSKERTTDNQRNDRITQSRKHLEERTKK